ncbi:hypothetical protein [Halococcoides cellulosivorans]|uniref:Uncharacterized protein n=1 Tax=Halococcoides cellulosivorans TaxID=1679096 RepID=A0A2R4X3H4_9EURY|nr:hypothetical protein [Halococcoides cellulosivorans]AWB28350.1 hypothetical protein HARCEL1_11850 [Halococcoides cellulosivorans]
MSTESSRTIAAVIPASDPSAVARTIRRLPAMVNRAYVVDNGTRESDWTAICRLVAEASQADRGTDRVVAVPRARETGTGIETGYLRALDDGVDMTIVLDSDRADPAAITPHIASIVDDVDGLQPLVAIDPEDPGADDPPATTVERDDAPTTRDAGDTPPAHAETGSVAHRPEADSTAAQSDETTAESSRRAEPAEIDNV